MSGVTSCPTFNHLGLRTEGCWGKEAANGPEDNDMPATPMLVLESDGRECEVGGLGNAPQVPRRCGKAEDPEGASQQLGRGLQHLPLWVWESRSGCDRWLLQGTIPLFVVSSCGSHCLRTDVS